MMSWRKARMAEIEDASVHRFIADVAQYRRGKRQTAH